jgi:hypothetical protein
MFLAPKRPQVVDEVFDAETVVVHLESGCYYSFDPAATVLWGYLADGADAQRLAELSGLPAADVESFVATLLAEDLLVEVDGDGSQGAEPVDVSSLVAAGGAPAFERFTDMQDLLLIDPVHDIAIDGDGWPVAR